MDINTILYMTVVDNRQVPPPTSCTDRRMPTCFNRNSYCQKSATYYYQRVVAHLVTASSKPFFPQVCSRCDQKPSQHYYTTRWRLSKTVPATLPLLCRSCNTPAPTTHPAQVALASTYRPRQSEPTPRREPSPCKYRSFEGFAHYKRPLNTHNHPGGFASKE